MNKIFIAVLGILIILGGLAFYFYSNKQVQPTEIGINNPSPEITPSASIEEVSTTLESSSSGVDALKQGGNSYLDPQGRFNFLYPNDYKQDLQNENKIVRIYKNGPTQKGQTEMYDGIMITFEPVTLDTDLSSWTDGYIKDATSGGTSQITESKKPFSLNNYSGYAFKMRGLGEFQFYTLQKNNTSKNGLVITTMAEDPTNRGFQTEINNILSTLQILK